MNDKIKNLLSRLTLEPGVYLMKDEKGEIIYIGKAKSLKKRVTSYFQKKNHDPKTKVLVKNIEDIEYIVTDSEIEALLLEDNLIKKHKPKFNIQLKDDKRYPYIVVTIDEKYPRVTYSRNLWSKTNKYFGPYTDSRAARNTVELINKIFKLKTCRKKLPLNKNERPCLNFQMKKCNGICTGEITREDYLILINNAIKFLEGNVSPVLKNIQEKMEEYSKLHQFEKAAQMRDIIFDIQKISETQNVSVPVGMDQDFIATSIFGSEAVVILFEYREGILLGRKISSFNNANWSDKGDIIRTFLIEYYSRSEIPNKIVTQTKIKDKEIIEDHLKMKSSKKVKLATPVSPEDKAIIRMIEKNIDIIIADRKAEQTYSDKERGISDLQKILNMKKPPKTMVCFDISNTQGTNSVASMVSFTDGLPDKKNYRKFKIRGYDTPNDPAMIHEAVTRRLQYLINEEIELPDLIVIDGGITQLGRAKEAANNFDTDVKIISLAKKREEIFYDVKKPPIIVNEDSPSLHILQNIRDESHRFAITYHRNLRSKELLSSELDNIPDIGEKTRKLLLKELKSIDVIKKTSIEELSKIEGIGIKTAEKIYESFH